MTHINRTVVVERDSRALTLQVMGMIDQFDGAVNAIGTIEAARDEAQAAAAQAGAALEQTILAASYTIADLDALKASTVPYPVGAIIQTRAEGYAFEVVSSGGHLTTAGGVMLRPALFSSRVTPRMFGARGDGTGDDRAAIQACWDFAGLNRIPVHMEGLEYNCSESVFTSSNLTVYGQGAVMYITAWPAVGGFINNARPVVAERVQSNIRIHDLVTDGSKLPPPSPTQNTNLGPSFVRGASNVRVINCMGRKCRDGFGGGTGGCAFGGEQGLRDVQFIGCVVEDCYRGVRVAGIPGEHSPGVSREATGVVFRDLVARRCGTAIFCHSVGHGGDDQSDLSIFDVLFDGVYIEDCGHYPWREFDFAAHPAISPQKTGAIVFGGAQNIRLRGVRVKTNPGFPGTFTDWLGRTGYPASGNYIGAGLSGPIGALVWGWGRNIVVEDITLDGSVDAYWNCSRPVTFGDIGSVAPTHSTDGTVQQIVFEDIRHVRPGVYNYVYAGHSGMDNAKFSARMTVTPTSNPTIGVVDPGGASLSNLLIKFVANNGPTQEGNAVDWLAAGNVRPTGAQRRHEKGGYDVGGGYSSLGKGAGQSYDPAAGILRSSQAGTAALYHLAFYSGDGVTGGLRGGIRTNGSATEYLTSSDARLKDDPKDFDGLGIVDALRVYDHAWLAGGRGYGVFAQEAAEVVPEAVSVGDDDDEWNAKGVGDRVPWSVDYSKLVPVLIRAVQQLSAEVAALRGDA